MKTSPVLKRRAIALLSVAPLAALALSISTAGTSNAAPTTVVTGGGAAATDPLWNATPPAGSATAATIVTTAPAGWTATVPGAKWIGLRADATSAPDPAGTYVFEAAVTSPVGSAISGSVASADPLTISLVQGATTTTLPGTFGGSATTPTPVTFAGPLAGGAYTLRVTVAHTDIAAPVGMIGSLTLSDPGTTEPPATVYRALPVPIRVYDSRTGTGPAATGDGVLASGQTRTISLATGFNSQSATTRVPAVPTGATSAMINVTIDGTVNTGFLTAYAATATQPASSSINWFGTGQILANLNVVAVAADGTIKITAGGGGSAQVVVDVLGYYRTTAA